ncbi:MAG: flagellar cap protein [Gammaproteobacteria bacterium]|nr:MAG: flagellar cap protein [Gammaproteobacteria bacterium]
MAITSAGIGSGLDIGGLVSQLVAAEGQPALFRLNSKEARLQADLSGVGTLKSALSQFQDSVKALNDLETFQSRRATSSDAELFSVSADTSAVASSYSIEVMQLAESAKLRSGDFSSETEVVGTGTLDISLGADTFQLTIDGTNNILADVRDAINSASDNPGIQASIINIDSGTRLILTSEKVGSANTIDIVATDDDAIDGFDLTQLSTANLTTIQVAQDAIIEVDGQTATRDNNSFSDVITGVNFTLNKADVGVVETLTVALDSGSVKSKVDDFVTAYNSLADTMKTLSAYDPDSGRAGALQGDSLLRGVQNQIRQTLTSGVAGLDFGTLAEAGVTTNEAGHLEVDSDKLDDVIDNDFTAISQLFASENGLANSLDTILEAYISSGGTLSSRTESIQSRIDLIDDDRSRLNTRLAALEARYTAQFTAMDILVSQLQSLGSALTGQLAGLPKPNSINNN